MRRGLLTAIARRVHPGPGGPTEGLGTHVLRPLFSGTFPVGGCLTRWRRVPTAKAATIRGILEPMNVPRSQPEPGEQELVERARSGDRQAFDLLIVAHLPHVWRVVWRMLRHHEDTEDVVQESFLTAYKSLADYRGEASLSTWLHRIAMTRALNHRNRSAERLRRASVPLENADDEEPPIDRRAAPELATPRSASPLQALEAKELMRRLSDCLGLLPPAWSAVLALRDGEDLSYETIAEQLALNLGTVRSRLARGRVALRRCIEGHKP